MKLTTAVLAMILCAPAAALAQRVQIDHLDRLADRAEEVVNVTITPEMLKLFSSIIPENDANALAAKKMVGALRGIYVRVFEFSSARAYSADDINTIRKQLTNPRWNRMVTVDSKRDGEMVDVYMWMDDGKIDGLFVMVAEPNELVVVNIVGPIDPSMLPALRGLGVPDLPAIQTPAARKQ